MIIVSAIAKENQGIVTTFEEEIAGCTGAVI
jgi:hypothetical protein